MDAEARRKLIEKYRAGYPQIVRALDGFPAGELTTRAFPGKWSAAEIVHHLADSETQSGTRLRKLLAEAHPVIQSYDQEQWAKTLESTASSFRKTSNTGKGKIPAVVPVRGSSKVVPLMPFMTKSCRASLACQFRTTSDSGSGTGSERSRIESMKL